MTALLLVFLAGALLSNAVPHLVSGLRGETFYLPWTRSRGNGHGPATQNFLWGAANLVAGLALLRSWFDAADRAAQTALIAGFVLGGLGISAIFAQRNAQGTRRLDD